MTSPIRILNIGSGAIGAHFSSRLATIPSVELYSICRSNYDQVKNQGFTMNSTIYGTYSFKPKQVFKSIQEASDSGLSFDYNLITTKCLPDQVEMDRLIQPVVGKDTKIILVQNGVDIERPYLDQFPNHTLLSCIATIGVTQTNPGTMSHVQGGHLGVGIFSKGQTENSDSLQHPHIIEFDDLLTKAKIPHELIQDIEFARWNKLMWNGSFSPICILAGGCNTLQIEENPETLKLVKDTMKEIRDLAYKVKGKEFPKSVQYKTIDQHLGLVKGLKYEPSLLVDYQRKNPLELEATLGNALRIAKSIDHPVPLTEAFYSLLKIADANNRNLLNTGH